MIVEGVNVFIRKDKRFLAIKRSQNDEIFGGMWALPGGKIESGETARDTAKREIAEETGLTLVSLESQACVEIELNIDGFPRMLIHIYRGEVGEGLPKPQDADIDDVVWIDRESFVDSLRKNNFPQMEIRKLERFMDAEGLE